jgi:hypothetical protein
MEFGGIRPDSGGTSCVYTGAWGQDRGTMRDTATARESHGRTVEPMRDPLETAQATFECTECGMELPARRGECPSCETWWTPVECLPGRMRRIAPPADERADGGRRR